MRLLAFLAVLLASTAAQAVTLVDRIVAVVNKEVITYSELYEAVGMAERQLKRQGTPAPERPVLERQMLERLIIDKAQLQLARDSGVRVDDLQVDRAVERIAASNNLTLAEFRRTLEADGVGFETWRADIRSQMIMGRLREREVENRVQVSESEVDVFLEQAKARPDNSEYNIAHILVRVPEGASPERIRQARERAEQALGEIKGGAPFGRVAASYSDAPDALQGGTIGWRNHDRLPEIFSGALAKMQPGQVSDPLRTPFGYHIMQVLERRASDVSPERKRIQARQALRDRKADEAYTEWLRQLRDSTYVELRLDER